MNVCVFPKFIFLKLIPNVIMASLEAQLVNNPPATQETPLRFLGWKDPPEKKMATHSSILRLPWWLKQ